jgi:hypothetical protein
VTFSSVKDARTYVKIELPKWLDAQTVLDRALQNTEGETLQLETLFQEEGRSLSDALRSGQDECDENIEKVRLDRYV